MNSKLLSRQAPLSANPRPLARWGILGLPGCCGFRRFRVFLFPAQIVRRWQVMNFYVYFLVTCGLDIWLAIWRAFHTASSHVNPSKCGSRNEKPRRLRLEGEMNYLHCLEVPAQLN